MEHTTFAKKTVVLATLGALSLMAATVRAADETEVKPTPIAEKITVTIGQDVASKIEGENSDVTWAQDWFDQHKQQEGTTFGGVTVVKGTDEAKTITVTDKGSLTINLPTSDADSKFVTFQGTGLKVENGGVFSNSSYVKFDKGSLTVTDADFTNGEKGVIELAGEGAEFNLSVSTAEAAGNVENAGRIVLGDKATMTVGSGNVLSASSDDKLTLDVGNVTIGSDATLTNKDKGYQVGNGANEQADGEEETAPIQTLVQFGTVTVDGGQFKDVAEARSNGTALVIKSVAEGKNAAEINGTSVWGALRLSKVSGDQGRESFVQINDGGDFSVTSDLVIDQFADNDSSFTIDGSKDSQVFADGINISAGSHVESTVLELKEGGEGLSWVNNEAPAVGTLKLKGFKAVFTPANDDAEQPEGEGKAETGDDETAAAGSWTNKKFGDVTVANSNIEISGSHGDEDALTKNGYTPSIEMTSFNLLGTSMKVNYDVEVKLADIKTAIGDAANEIDWTKDDVLEQLEALLEEDKYATLKKELEGKLDSFENGLAGVLNNFNLNAVSSIKGSDLAIGTLQIALEGETVEVDKSVASGSTGSEENQDGVDGQADDNAEEDKDSVAITGDKTYDLSNLTLKIENSNLDVDTLDLQTGAIILGQGSTKADSDGSIMMVGNVKTLNGSLTLEKGYLGLNVTKSVADVLEANKGVESSEDSGTPSANATVEVGSPVTIGATGQLNFGAKPEAGTFAEGDETTAKTEDHAIGFFTDTNIVFDGKNFNSEALFSQDRTDGNKGIVAVNGTGTKLTVKATNLSWGVYKLFDEDTLNTDALEGKVSIDTSSGDTVSDLWRDAVGNKISADSNEIVVGGTTIEGSGLDIGAVNLANSVVGGDRGSALDKALFNHILSNGKSLEEISNTINSITAMGAVAGLTAMTVDFGAYVTDQVEHHASTIPHQQEGWWVQPIAGKLKSDDLAVGGMKGGYSIDTVGIMGGFDKKLRNGDTIGVAASYQSGDADSEGEGLPVTTDVTNYGLHLWHARQFDAYRLMGMFSYSKTSGDAKMNYVGNELTSDLGATEISIGARADKEFKWGTVRMIPHAGVRASMIDVDDYTIEMGSEELFKVSEDKLWIFEVPVGVTFASSFEYARWNVQPYVDLTVRGRFGDTDSTFTLEGSNTSDSMKYDVTGDVIGDLRIGYMSTFQDLNLGMSYGLSAGDGGRQNHQIEATLRIDFK